MCRSGALPGALLAGLGALLVEDILTCGVDLGKLLKLFTTDVLV